MVIRFIIFLSVIVKTYGNIKNSFIIDYFRHAKVASVVGFSCNSEKGKHFYT